MYKLLISAILLFCCVHSYQQLETKNLPPILGPEQELLYFPKGEHLKAVSFGFQNALSNYLWFQTVNYFGKHYREDQNYYWLSHMCNVITDLDPYHKELYEFCSYLVAWENKNTVAGQKLLSKGIQFNPKYWRFYYLRGMNHVMFDKDEVAARDDFIAASKAPDAPFFVNSLATKQIANLNNPETAVSFLIEMIENAKDPNQKRALEEHLKKTLNEISIAKLEAYRDQYQEKFKSLPKSVKDLKSVGALDTELLDPNGEIYRIDEKGALASKQIKERISLFKTKEEKEHEAKLAADPKLPLEKEEKNE